MSTCQRCGRRKDTREIGWCHRCRRRLGSFLLAIFAAALGLAAPAQAETITGTFQYLDRDLNLRGTTTTRTLRPIAGATVEVYECAPGASCGWSLAATTSTNAAGAISVSVTRPAGTMYELRVHATNNAAVVWPKVVIPSGPFYEQPGKPEGAAIRQVVTSPTDTLDFSYDFNDFWTAAHYNIAETILLGRQYALARRHPLESDSSQIPQVSVQPTSIWPGVSWFNTTVDQLAIKDTDVYDDVTLLHEYAHFLQKKISHFAAIASNHDGCKATRIGDATAVPINSEEHAWMEGFADYFAAAVISSLPTGRTSTFGIATGANLEAPPGIFTVPTCTLMRGTVPADTIELDVAAVLWDLLDGGSGESVDTVAGRDVEIFRIFDRELDTAFQPTIEAFRSAWVAQGLPAAGLGRIYTLNGLTFRRNLAPIADAGPDRDVYEGATVVLNGASSEDPEVAPLTVTWTQTGGPSVTLASPTALTPSFTAPPVGPAGTTFTFRLDVSEGPGGLSATDFVQVRVRDLAAYGVLTPSPLDFGVRRAGVKVTQTVTLTNIGPGPLDVGTMHLAGSTVFRFDGTSCGAKLAPNASCSVSLGFVPPASGSVDGTFIVATPNSPNTTVSIRLRGEGGTPAAALDKGSLSFGSVNMGAAVTEQIRLWNTGTVPVTVASVTTGVGTGFSHSGCLATIGAGSSCVITVTFSPTAAGPTGAWLVIDDDGGGPRYIQLSGTGVPVGVPSASPSALAFGPLSVGSASASATVGLTNVGGTPLYVWDVRVAGHYADFRIVSDQCRGISLQPWTGCVVQVVFEPQATGPRSGALEFAANGIVTATLTGTGVAKPVQTAWTQLGFGPARGGFNAEEIGIDATSAASLVSQWDVQARIKAEARSAPAVVDGVAYLGSDDGSVHAVEVASQKLLWSAATGGAVRSSPAVVDGVVYVGSEDGSLYALGAAEGNVLWTFATKGPIESSPAVVGPIALVGSLDGNVYAIDVATGTERWAAALGGPAHGSPALAGPVAYAAGGNMIRAFALRNGRVLWTEFANGPVKTGVTVSDGRVLVGSDGGRVYAFSAASGAALWHFDASGPVASSPAAAYGIVFAGSDGGDLTALDAASGAPIWTLQAGPSRSAPAVANGVVYVTTEDGRVLAVDAWTGTELASVEAKALSSPAVVGGAVYVGSASGLTALAP